MYSLELLGVYDALCWFGVDFVEQKRRERGDTMIEEIAVDE